MGLVIRKAMATKKKKKKKQNGENVPNYHKIYQMAIKYFLWP
jgi:hypothetical protein